jgi:tetratricopeptide (TPR) repeat protein
MSRSLHLSETHRVQLEALNQKASRYLRTGGTPAPSDYRNDLALIDRICRPPSEYEEADQKTVLEVLRRFADIADRVGDYPKSRGLLADRMHWVQEQLRNPKFDTDADKERLAELIWCVIVFSVTEHRDNDIPMALQHVRAAVPLIELLTPRDRYLNIRCRVEYALGRHLQSLARPKWTPQAESHYTKSLEYCAEITRTSAKDARSYATYRSAVALIGLARICVDRGELARGLRHLFVAKLLLTGSSDVVTMAFVEFLFGCIFRQQNRLSDAIGRLIAAIQTFKTAGHQRYFLRCRHELAKARLNEALESKNDAHFKQASDVLGSLPPAQSAFPSGGRAQARWDEENEILAARIAFERARQCPADGKVNETVLRQSKTQIEESLRTLSLKKIDAPDIRAKGLIIESEIDLCLGHVKDVEKRLLWITSKGSSVLDAADLGWAWLVIGEARLAQRQIDAARVALIEYRKLSVENAFFGDRADAMHRDITTRSEGALSFPPFRTDGHPRKWSEYEMDLKRWLLDELTNHLKMDLPAQAKVLGLRNVTIKDWYEKLGLDTPVAREKKPKKDPSKH